MSHVKKAEAFARLVGFCSGYGGTYDPGRPNLQLDALINQLNETRSAMENVKTAKTEFDNLVNYRKQTFDRLPRLLSSMLRTLEASGAKPEKLEDARSFVHQIIGTSSRKPEPLPTGQTDQPEAVHRSLMQLAYVSKADFFSSLVMCIASEPLYRANEKHLNQAGLAEKVKELNQLNRQVAEARANWSNAILDRNRMMYKSETSTTRLARAAKKYVRAIYGHDSQEYAQLKSLNFNNPTG